MPAYTLYTWIARHIGIRPRLERVCVYYLLFLMVTTTKHIFGNGMLLATIEGNGTATSTYV